VQHDDGLLIYALRRHEPHVRSRYGLANGLGVGSVILIGLDVGLYELRSHQFHRVAESFKATGEEVRSAAGFHANQAGREICEVGK
jgi:hypothetical protein